MARTEPPERRPGSRRTGGRHVENLWGPTGEGRGTPAPSGSRRPASPADPPAPGAGEAPDWEFAETSAPAGGFPRGQGGEGREPRDPGPGGAHAGRSSTPSPPRSLPDLSWILTVLDAVRAALPQELQQRFTALLREVLLAVRALIDRYLDRIDGRSKRTRVEDIPID